MSILEKIQDSLDWRKVRVLGGDIPTGLWDFNGGMMTPDPTTGRSDVVALMGEIEKLQIQTEESVRDVAKTLGFTLAGGLLLGGLVGGPVGAAVGFFAAGKRKEVCLLCVLKDGRKFLAVVDQRIYQQMLGLSMMGGDSESH
jgi:hypothetical protein